MIFKLRGIIKTNFKQYLQHFAINILFKGLRLDWDLGDLNIIQDENLRSVVIPHSDEPNSPLWQMPVF